MPNETYIASLKMKRDTLIQELWVVLNKLFNEIGTDSLTMNDINLWTQVTSHPSFQKNLKSEKGLHND